MRISDWSSDVCSSDLNTVFLKVMAFAGNIADDFALIGQADLGNLAQSRVRLFRGCGINTSTYTAFLRVCLHRGNFRARFLRLPNLADQLVNRRHEALHLCLVTLPAHICPNGYSPTRNRPRRSDDIPGPTHPPTMRTVTPTT